jgi:hypothetical protein
MLELRTVEGVEEATVAPGSAEPLLADDLLRRDGTRLVLTLRGRQLADFVTRELAAPPRAGHRAA